MPPRNGGWRPLPYAHAVQPPDAAPAADLLVGALGGDRARPAAHLLRRAPDPRLLAALERVGGTPAEAVYVGDSPFDLQAARAAGTAAIGVTWGAFVRAKTGTLNDASTLSGYAGACAFSVLVQRTWVDQAAAHALQDRIAQLLARRSAEC